MSEFYKYLINEKEIKKRILKDEFITTDGREGFNEITLYEGIDEGSLNPKYSQIVAKVTDGEEEVLRVDYIGFLEKYLVTQYKNDTPIKESYFIGIDDKITKNTTGINTLNIVNDHINNLKIVPDVSPIPEFYWTIKEDRFNKRLFEATVREVLGQYNMKMSHFLSDTDTRMLIQLEKSMCAHIYYIDNVIDIHHDNDSMYLLHSDKTNDLYQKVLFDLFKSFEKYIEYRKIYNEIFDDIFSIDFYQNIREKICVLKIHNENTEISINIFKINDKNDLIFKIVDRNIDIKDVAAEIINNFNIEYNTHSEYVISNMVSGFISYEVNIESVPLDVELSEESKNNKEEIEKEIKAIRFQLERLEKLLKSEAK